MPILHNAKKALRVSQRETVINQVTKSKSKTMIDIFRKEPTLAQLGKAFSAIDRSVKNNLIHKNKAARIKSQLSKKVK